MLKRHHICQRPKILILLDLKGTYNRSTIFNVLKREGAPLNYASILRALYAQTTGKVRDYGQLSQSFDTSCGVWRGCLLSPFLFNFVMDEVMHSALAEHENVRVELVMRERLCYLEYTGDLVCLFDTAKNAQHTLDRLKRAFTPFGICFAPSKCKLNQLIKLLIESHNFN